MHTTMQQQYAYLQITYTLVEAVQQPRLYLVCVECKKVRSGQVVILQARPAMDAAVMSFHLSLSPTSSSSLTRFRTVVMPYKPALFKFFSILSIHRCFERPTGRFPVGFQLRTMDGHLSLLILDMCPYQRNAKNGSLLNFYIDFNKSEEHQRKKRYFRRTKNSRVSYDDRQAAQEQNIIKNR